MRLTDGEKHILIGTAQASLIRFKETDVRAMSRIAAGVKGIRLRDGDEVIGLDVADDDNQDEILVVTEKGYGKRTSIEDYRLSNRGGMGVKTAKLTERNGRLVCITTVEGDEDLMVVTNQGVIIRMEVSNISVNGRMAQGVRLIRLDEEQYVSTVAKVKKEPEDIEADEHTTASEASDDVEVVVDDVTPGDTIHTEAPEPEVSPERETLREDFMDRVNEDIENEDE